jgi:ABC-2 type transport system ATP-binding protein
LIEVKGLTKYYGAIAAIDRINFEVGRGEITGFLGPNGAGKSTTMRILTGFSPASSGTARVDGHEVHVDPLAVKQRVGYLPERVPLYEEMVVSSFLKYVAEVKGIDGRSARAREADRVMERCGLAHMAKRLIGNLSKGYRQRVGLAQALVASPPVLVLDEPTVGLDPQQIIEVRRMIKDLGEEHTILISTHILPEVSMVCDRVIIIDQGRVVAEDSMSNLSGGGGKGRLHLEVGGEQEAIVQALQGLDCVESARHVSTQYYEVVGRGKGEDVGPALANALVTNGFALHRIEGRARTLEDVFMESVSSERRSDVSPADAEGVA